MTSDVEVAIRAATAAREVIRRTYGSPVERIGKSDADFATEVDLAAERAIREVLREARPGDAIVGEEYGGDKGDGSRTWLVDPLCGTVNYAARTPLVAVNVALRVRDRVTAAVSADPFSGEVFWTGGEGAFAGHFRPRVVSTTLALAWVAAGRWAAYLTDGHLRDSVHFTSGIALCQAAGCVVTNLAGQAVHTGIQGLVAAADRETHQELIDLVNRSRHALGRPTTPAS